MYIFLWKIIFAPKFIKWSISSSSTKHFSRLYNYNFVFQPTYHDIIQLIIYVAKNSRIAGELLAAIHRVLPNLNIHKILPWNACIMKEESSSRVSESGLLNLAD